MKKAMLYQIILLVFLKTVAASGKDRLDYAAVAADIGRAEALQYRAPSESIQIVQSHLSMLAESSATDILRLRSYHCLAAAHGSLGDGKEAGAWAKASLKLAVHLGDARGVADAKLGLAVAHDLLGSYDAALECADQAQAYFSVHGDKKQVARLERLRGGIAFRRGEYPAALQHSQISLKLNGELGDEIEMGLVMSQLGSVYYDVGVFAQALRYHTDALKAFQRASDARGESKALGNLANIYLKTGNHSLARSLYQRLVKQAVRMNDQDLLCKILCNLGVTTLEMGRGREAIGYFERGLAIAESGRKRYLISIILGNLADAQTRAGALDRALAHAGRSLTLAEELGSSILISNAIEQLVLIRSARHDFTAASTLRNRLEAVRAKIFSEQLTTRMADLQARYESEKTRHQLSVLRREKALSELKLARNRVLSSWLILGLAGLAFAITIGLLRYRARYERQQELESKNSELAEAYGRLEKAMSEVRALSGLLPICCSCKKIRDDSGYWHQVEEYIADRSEAEFSHSYCPDCMAEYINDFRQTHMTGIPTK